MHIIAHRGFSAEYPENTLLAFREAINAGAWMIETDIRLSADDVPVIFHDSSLQRVCGLREGVEDLPYEVLSKIDISSYFDSAMPLQTIPTLAELLDSIHGEIGVILEIKYHPKTCEKIASIVEPMIADKLDWLEVSSFDDGILEDFHVRNPAIKLHKLIEDVEVLQRSDFVSAYGYVYAFDIDINLLNHPKTQSLMQTHKVIFWTVDDQDPITFPKAFAAMSNNPIHLKQRIAHGRL
ncbi:MAG: glycerophosphodiester phosphodiesterase [Sulfuricurvum sp.]|jgi:glycerophosphoryl diester phosphodiesterase|nr:glycerophosphodiester phosphodiesterase [Sulfuricurvum sp.]